MPDRKLLKSNPDVAAILGQSLAEAYKHGIEGVRAEAALIGGPRLTPLETILQPVDIFQGGQDRNVPPAMSDYLAEQLANASVHFRQEEGHLSILLESFASYAQRFRIEYALASHGNF